MDLTSVIRAVLRGLLWLSGAKTTPPAPATPPEPQLPAYPMPPHTPTLPPPPVVPTPPGDIPSWAVDLINLHNAERSRRGLTGLTAITPLTGAAQQYAELMSRLGRADSHTLDGRTPSERITASGVTWAGSGENIAAGQPTVEEVVQAWMNSSGHRANILNPGFRYIGVGLAADTAGYHYWCVTFVRPAATQAAAQSCTTCRPRPPLQPDHLRVCNAPPAVIKPSA